MFNHLKPFSHILVTGPHRSGTTFASFIIAKELGYRWYEEPEALTAVSQGYPPDVDLTPLFGGEKNVIHCPSLCAFVHRYAGLPGVAVVMMVRPVKDILASQKRVGWGFEERQLSFYGKRLPDRIAQVKYDYWREQRAILGNQAIELEYKSLRSHPMWVSKKRRADFHIAQIEPGIPRGDRVQNSRLASD